MSQSAKKPQLIMIDICKERSEVEKVSLQTPASEIALKSEGNLFSPLDSPSPSLKTTNTTQKENSSKKELISQDSLKSSSFLVFDEKMI